MYKKKLNFLLAAALAGSLFSAMPVMAAEETISSDMLTVDMEGSAGTTNIPKMDVLGQVIEDNTGSIRITLTDGKEGTSKEGVPVYCIKIADIEAGEYVLEEAYASSGVDLNNIQNASELAEAATKLKNTVGEITDTDPTDSNGEIYLDDLEVGVYLVGANDTETYDDVTPALVAIPTFDDTAGEMSYDIIVEPKHTPKPDEPETPKEEGKDAPQTGVDSPVILCFAGAVVILAGLAVVNVRWKKKNR